MDGGGTRGNLVPQMDIGMILMEARSRWLKPLEIVDILKNFAKYEFQLNQEPPIKPKCGSLYLFDRKVVRYFRKDGHNWRKKKDGKTVREAHEKLKAGSVDMLHCYYAHSEEDDRFQRRCYWLLEEALEHVVLVHYLVVPQGSGRAQISPKSSAPSSPGANSPSPPPHLTPYSSPPHFFPPGPPTALHATSDLSNHSPYSPASTQQHLRAMPPPGNPAAEYDSDGGQEMEEGQGDTRPLGMGFSSFAPLLQQHVNTGSFARSTVHSPQLAQPPPPQWGTGGEVVKTEGWERNGIKRERQANSSESLEGIVNPRIESTSLTRRGPPIRAHNFEDLLKPSTAVSLKSHSSGSGGTAQFADPDLALAGLSPVDLPWNGLLPGSDSRGSQGARGGPGEETLPFSWTDLVGADTRNSNVVWTYSMPKSTSSTGREPRMPSWPSSRSMEVELPFPFPESGSYTEAKEADIERERDVGLPLSGLPPRMPDRDSSCSMSTIQLFLAQMKADSVGGKSSSGRGGTGTGTGTGAGGLRQGSEAELEKLDSFGKWVRDMCPAPGDQVEVPAQQPEQPPEQQSILFHILDFSPAVCSTEGGEKVLVVGSVGGEAPLRNGTWGCLFGTAEVPAEVIAPGVLRCISPPHPPGVVPFCVTAGSRGAASLMQRLEYKGGSGQAVGEKEVDEGWSLRIRLVRILTGGEGRLGEADEGEGEGREAKWAWMDEDGGRGEAATGVTATDHLLKTLLKSHMEVWVRGGDAAQRVGETDEGGMGVLHLCGALGYSWAVPWLAASGCDVDAPDSAGRTALHWAAACGREKTVVALLAAGAAPAMLAGDGGCTPADLAEGNAHSGIAAYLSEVALNRSLSTMSLHEGGVDPGASAASQKSEEAAVARVSGGRSTGGGEGKMEASLVAVKNAAHSAALIRAAYRQQSMQRRRGEGEREAQVARPKGGAVDENGLTEEEVRVVVAARKVQNASRGREKGAGDKHHLAATKIQQKFRGWRGRRNFLAMRHRIVVLQAHVRGHLTRRNLRRMRWSVGILEKAILRWRRKRPGLRFLDHLPHRGLPAQVVLKPMALLAPPSPPPAPSPEAERRSDGELWRHAEGSRSERESALSAAVGKVQDMVRSEEGRAQYARLKEAETTLQGMPMGDTGTGDRDADMLPVS